MYSAWNINCVMSWLKFMRRNKTKHYFLAASRLLFLPQTFIAIPYSVLFPSFFIIPTLYLPLFYIYFTTLLLLPSVFLFVSILFPAASYCPMLSLRTSQLHCKLQLNAVLFGHTFQVIAPERWNTTMKHYKSIFRPDW